MNLRSLVLSLLAGKRPASFPCFSGLSTIIAPALEARGLVFHEIHSDASKMIVAAASAYELYGWQSATLPTNLCVEAEALGATVDYRADMPEPMWPLVAQPLFETPKEFQLPQGNFVRRGRIPQVTEAIRGLKARVGTDVAVGAFIPGPFTLAVQVVDYNNLLPAVKHSPTDVAFALAQCTEILEQVAQAYCDAGADFVTIHEMGGSPGVLGPRAFGNLILPQLQRLTAAIHVPTILSVCGNTNQAMELLAQAGATALNVEHTNDLVHSRAVLGPEALLFGNLDPVGVIADGTVEQIRGAMRRAADAGVDAIMPGCDLYFQTPAENLKVLAQGI